MRCLFDFNLLVFRLLFIDNLIPITFDVLLFFFLLFFSKKKGSFLRFGDEA